MDIKQNVATNIARFRKYKKLTQAELATKLNYSDKAVSKWERGESLPDVSVLYEIARFFGTTVDKLISEPTEEIPIKLVLSNKKRSILCVIATCLVWLFALIAYCLPTIIETSILTKTWIAFIYALPLSFFILCIMFSVWKKSLSNLIILSLLIWTIILSIYLSFLVFDSLYPRLWLIFLIGLPLQLLIVLLYTYKRVK